MKCTIPEISWHNKDPVLSLDIQLTTDNEFYRLASGGSDSHVLIWHMIFSQSGSINLDLAADLTRHQRAVNVVKWSTNGKYLASGDDESVIFIWKMKEDSEILNILDDLNEQDKECWITLKVLRGHVEDVYDLSWCPNSLFMASASIDNTVIIWDIQKGKSIGLLDGHKGFVQGVSWDPKNQYIATLCTDRYLRIFDVQTKKVVVRVNKCPLSIQKNKGIDDKMERIFHDDTLQTFFRRLSFSPDGNLLVTPSGIIECETESESKLMHASYIFSRQSFKQPAIILPSPDEYTVVVTFCPLLFKLKKYSKSNMPIISLPYRMVFAIATKNSVYLYDTQQKIPFGTISNIHYTRLTDMTWSKDGKILAVSSTDGFCSLLTFSDGELGEIYNAEETETSNKYIVSENNGNETCVKDTHKNSKGIEILLNLHINKSETKPIEQYENETNVKNIKTKHINSDAKLELSEENHLSTTPKSIPQQTGILPLQKKNEITEMANQMHILTTNKDKQVTLIEEASLENDIRLFYEDSQDESGKCTKTTQEENEKNSIEECKTPRRVQLKTISTPKSKKKNE